ncbi:ATP-binding cassette domain-containing protein, partial [Fusicatenibacter saccharivorans]
MVGHNGSGKSTIAKLMMGMMPFQKGEILVN